ncbi:hypothetical protein GCM10027425_18680 [Alteromonas gracilis]
MSPRTDVTVDQLRTAIDEGAVLIDVRESGEYAEGHVPGARLMPMSRLAARLDELDRSRPVHVICRSGNRSGAMVDLLVAQGFEARNVVGGTQAWADAGLPIDTGADRG